MFCKHPWTEFLLRKECINKVYYYYYDALLVWSSIAIVFIGLTLYSGRNRLLRLPLEPAVTAFIDRPFYRLKPAVWLPAKTMCLDKSIHCAYKSMMLHTQTLSTTFTNDFCACQSSPFTYIRLICSVFVEFITSFFHVLTCFNSCVAAMEARIKYTNVQLW